MRILCEGVTEKKVVERVATRDVLEILADAIA
jgi:hypothetical protein